MSKSILLISDMAGYSKVAISAMIPVLTHMKYDLHYMPTCLVSNNFDYGLFDILDTTQYVRNTMGVWNQLGFEFDAICTGFIVSDEQAELVTDYCRQKAESGCVIFTDPIMGDEGTLYNGVDPENVAAMRKLVAVADYIVPNYTEAAYLADMPYHEQGTTKDELIQIIDKLREMGAGSVVITSARLAGADLCSVVGYDAVAQDYFQIDYEEIPGRFPGTGDIFTSVFMGHIMHSIDMRTSTERAMDAVRNMIAHSLSSEEDRRKGLPIELSLDVLDA